MKNVLFVCAQNIDRSPTAERLFAGREGIDVCSAGINRDAELYVSPEVLEWADIIFVMEKVHRRTLQTAFKAHLNGKPIVCLDIPDIYTFMQPELQEILNERVSQYFGWQQAAS